MDDEAVDPTEVSVQRLHDEIVDLHTLVGLARTTSEAIALAVMVRGAIEGLQTVENAALSRANTLPSFAPTQKPRLH